MGIIDAGAGTFDVVLAAMEHGVITSKFYAQGDDCTGNKLTEAIANFVKDNFSPEFCSFAMAEKLKLWAIKQPHAAKIPFSLIWGKAIAQNYTRKTVSTTGFISRTEYNELVKDEVARLPYFLAELLEVT